MNPARATPLTGLRWAVAWGAAFLSFAWLCAAEAPKRMFSIRAAAAEESLHALADQAGIELGYNVQHVQGVRTKAVQGRFTTREALERLLAGSPLQVVQDAQTGAFFVNRRPVSPRRPPTPPSSRAEPEPADTADTRSRRESDAIVLSPFVVAMERNDSYAATGTLAGTRLNTPLRDLGAAISIYRRNLLSDLGLANQRELMIYAVGMEGAGPGGNFANATEDLGNPQVVGDGSRVSPQTQWRTRGLAAPNATRGFFVSDIDADTYNTEAVTVSRGPNAVLFGAGSPAGVVDTTLIAPDLWRHSARVETRVGDNSSFRQVLDFNRVLVPGRLAARMALLADEERFDQRPAFERKRRLFGAATFQPAAGTSLRVQFETGGTQANRPFQVLPFDSVSHWLAGGRPTWDWQRYDDPARNPDASTQEAGEMYNTSPARFAIGQAQIFSGIVTPFAGPEALLPDRSFRAIVQTGNGTNLVRNALLEPHVNRDAAFDLIAFYETFNVAEIPAAFYPDRRRPAGLKFQGFTDFEAFDFRRRQLDETGRQQDNFHTFTASLAQRGWDDRAGVEAAYYQQRYDTRSRNSFFGTHGNANHVRVDPNVTLPDGRPNPNLGRPYAVMSQALYDRRFVERGTLRLTGYLRHDFGAARSPLGRWLGRHTLTALHERADADVLSYQTSLRTTGPAAEQAGANIATFNRLPNLLVYLGDSVLDGSPLRLNPIRLEVIRDGLTSPTSFFAAPAGTPVTTQAEFTAVPTTVREIFTGGYVQRELIRSHAAVLQSNWAKDHLVTTLGWRRDADYLFRQNLAYDPAGPASPDRGLTDFRRPGRPPLAQAKEVKSASAVLRWPATVWRLPGGAEVAAFGNYAENFTPAGPRINYFGEQLPTPVGRTREAGLMFELPGRLSLRWTRFETTVRGATYNAPISINYHNAIVQMTIFWHMERNLNPGIDRTADIEEIFAALPANFRQVHNFQYFGTPEERNLARSNTLLNGVADTVDYVASGHEIELVYSPNRRFRLLANFARQETVQENVAPFTRGLVERMRPVWDRLADRPRTNYPVGHVPGTPLPLHVETVGQYVDAVIYTPYETVAATQGIVTAEQRQWRANVVGNYAFSRAGPLRGWSVGSGVRWQSRVATGYPARYNEAGRVVVDLANPYFAPAELNVDLFAAYTRRLAHNVEWTIQLNVRNAVGDHAPIPVTAQPDGSPASVRLAPEQRWYLTNTFAF